MVRVGELALTFLFHLHSQSHSLTIHHCPLRRSKQHVLFDPHIPVWYAVFSPKSRIFILFVFLFSLISIFSRNGGIKCERTSFWKLLPNPSLRISEQLMRTKDKQNKMLRLFRKKEKKRKKTAYHTGICEEKDVLLRAMQRTMVNGEWVRLRVKKEEKSEGKFSNPNHWMMAWGRERRLLRRNRHTA